MSLNNKSLLTSSTFGWVSAQTAELSASLSAQPTPPTFTSETTDSTWNQKADSRVPTAQSSSPYDPATQESISEWYSKQIITQPNSNEKSIRTGLHDSPSCAPSASQSQTLGSLPTDPKKRKQIPLYTGLVKYFPDALIAVAALSYVGNEQHSPGKPVHWDRSKSTDQHDTLLRHLFEAGTVDTDGVRHSAKVAWRALAALQLEIENNRA